jgi:Mitochondrial K+-H+ exchange-related
VNVYLVPAACDRYALYCEVRSTAPVAEGRTDTLRGRLLEGFRRLVDEGEAEPQRPATEDESTMGRLRRMIARRIAEAVAEQRLLWHLRHETAVHLLHPHDLSSEQGIGLARTLIAADFAKHRRWSILDALITCITGPAFFFLPGPNVVSWYFGFRAVGHYFAMRGAEQGLSRVSWTGVPAPELAELRAALTLDAEARQRRVEEISATLGLNRLPVFFEKVA